MHKKIDTKYVIKEGQDAIHYEQDVAASCARQCASRQPQPHTWHPPPQGMPVGEPPSHSWAARTPTLAPSPLFTISYGVQDKGKGDLWK